MKKVLKLVILLIILSVSKINAATCTTEELADLKQKAENLEITYVRKEPFDVNNQIDNTKKTIYDLYDVTISNFTSDFYITINDSTYNNTSDLANDNGVYLYEKYGSNTIYNIYATKCNKLLRKVEIYMPVFNNYSLREECKNNNTSIIKECSKWIEKKDYEYFLTLSEDDFKNILEENKDNNILDIITIYIGENRTLSIVIISSIILLIIILLAVVIWGKRSRLE